MTEDEESFVLAEFDRGDAVLRVSRKRYEGRPFTDIRLFFKADDGSLGPTRKGCSIRDHEIHEVLSALQKIASKIGRQPPRPAATHRQRPATVPSAQAPLSDDEMERLF